MAATPPDISELTGAEVTSDVTAEGIAVDEVDVERPGSAVVLSFAAKVAEKEQERERRLYAGILARISHLQL